MNKLCYWLILWGLLWGLSDLAPQRTLAAPAMPTLGQPTLFLPIVANRASFAAGGDGDGQQAAPVYPQQASATGVLVFHHYDATGNLLALSDANGQAVWRADMRPFGQGAPSTPDYALRFAGQPQETGSGEAGGLYQLGARYYDPVTGRFLGVEPLSLAAIPRENPQRFNQYSYALNNPYRYQDASGQQAVTWQEQQARSALRNFVNFVEADLGPDPSFAARVAAFSYGPAVPPDAILNTNNEPIRNRNGQEVDLDWGARLAGLAVIDALDSNNVFSPALLAIQAKQEARKLYNPAKGFWNTVDWVGEQFGGARQTGPMRVDDPNILGVDLLIDFIVNGGDLRSYFDPAQAPARPAQP